MKAFKGVLIVLGAPNSDKGVLSEIALNRLDAAVQFYVTHPGYRVICTGGFGPHFNTTPTAHAVYASQYLIEKGIPAGDILPSVLSSHTLEDARLARPLIEQYDPAQVVVITSDFHMKRAKLIFTRLLENHQLLFVEAKSTLDVAILAKLLAHEEKALQQLHENNF